MRGNGAKYRGERGGGRLRRGWEERGECGRGERMVKDERNKGLWRREDRRRVREWSNMQKGVENYLLIGQGVWVPLCISWCLKVLPSLL